jgi:hypothetical protein
MSFDERFIFSAGSDSNIFGSLFNTSLDALEKAKTERIRVASKVIINQIVLKIDLKILRNIFCFSRQN